MKVIRIDTPEGTQELLTEQELHIEYTQAELDNFEQDEEITYCETRYTVRQLNRARKLRNDEDYCWNFEDEQGIAPSVYDILEYLYGGE